MVIVMTILTMLFFTIHMIYLLYHMIIHYLVSGVCVSSMDFFPNSPATSKDPLVVLCGGGLCTTTVPGTENGSTYHL